MRWINSEKWCKNTGFVCSSFGWNTYYKQNCARESFYVLTSPICWEWGSCLIPAYCCPRSCRCIKAGGWWWWWGVELGSRCVMGVGVVLQSGDLASSLRSSLSSVRDVSEPVRIDHHYYILKNLFFKKTYHSNHFLPHL